MNDRSAIAELNNPDKHLIKKGTPVHFSHNSNPDVRLIDIHDAPNYATHNSATFEQIPAPLPLPSTSACIVCLNRVGVAPLYYSNICE